MRHIVHAESQESLEEAYENFVSGELGEKYNNFLLYFNQFVWKNKECWAKFYRINLPVRGNHTQNYVEAQFRVIKDEIVNRVRCFNFIELIDKITEDLESHYKDKLLTVANGSFDGIFSKKYLKPLNHEDIKPDQISVINEESQIFAVVPSGKG